MSVKSTSTSAKKTVRTLCNCGVRGGLTLDKNGKDIVVNSYTRLRLEKTLEVEQQNDLRLCEWC